MSRENLKEKVLEGVKSLENKLSDYLFKENLVGKLLEKDDEYKGIAQDELRKYVSLINLKDFLEENKYDPFLDYQAKYEPGAVPAYPEGKTIWAVDDTAIAIIEQDVTLFINDVIHFMMKNSHSTVSEALEPTIIQYEYISVMGRCIYEHRQGKKDDKESN